MPHTRDFSWWVAWLAHDFLLLGNEMSDWISSLDYTRTFHVSCYLYNLFFHFWCICLGFSAEQEQPTWSEDDEAHSSCSLLGLFWWKEEQCLKVEKLFQVLRSRQCKVPRGEIGHPHPTSGLWMIIYDLMYIVSLYFHVIWTNLNYLGFTFICFCNLPYLLISFSFLWMHG